MSEPFRVTATGVTLRLRVTPNSGADRLEGAETRADGETVLKLRVAAVPDKGKANAAAIVLLGKALGVPKSAITLVAGDTARMKTVAISGDADELATKLGALRSGLSLQSGHFAPLGRRCPKGG